MSNQQPPQQQIVYNAPPQQPVYPQGYQTQPQVIQQPPVVYAQPPQGYQQPQQQVIVQQTVVQQQPVMGQVMPETYESMFMNRSRCIIEEKVDYVNLFTDIRGSLNFKCSFGDGYSFGAVEESNWFSRQFLGSKRPFTIHVKAPSGRDILKVKRPYAFCLPSIEVLDAQKNTCLGFVKSKCTFCSRDLTVEDPSGNELYKIHGPCLRPWTFFVEKDKQRVGKITRKWAGFFKEMLTNAENFGVEFPQRATSAEKALLYSSAFLIAFMYFDKEDQKQKNRDGY